MPLPRGKNPEQMSYVDMKDETNIMFFRIGFVTSVALCLAYVQYLSHKISTMKCTCCVCVRVFVRREGIG